MTTSAGFDLLEGILPKDEHQDQVQHEMQTDSTYSSSNHLAQRTDLDESLSKESGDADSRRQSDSRKSGSSRQDGDDLNSTGGSERANSASQETVSVRSIIAVKPVFYVTPSIKPRGTDPKTTTSKSV
eukprot:CAMPEP_0115007692 /NCGR_PEP_ID=MMETSP0216-20121206/21375_1 /TAXON_ID=223996 /ORGANISM="Protocruzia adherens, Strain Boccale" /LENGTH=127 /DNA_ID=CAMNT_0002374771 /DNA_START=891 /DNA_END=1275 /DNA_ORIENTATION=-